MGYDDEGHVSVVVVDFLLTTDPPSVDRETEADAVEHQSEPQSEDASAARPVDLGSSNQDRLVRFDDRYELTGERAEALAALFERRHQIPTMPEDLTQVDAWEELIADCERFGFPHLIGSARQNQYFVLSDAGLHFEAFQKYLQLMQLVHQYGDYIAAANIATFLDMIGGAAITAVSDPTMPLSQINQVIDLVEQATLSRSLNLAPVYFARAVVAATSGDGPTTFDMLDKMRAQGSEKWEADDVGTMDIEIPLIAQFDDQRAEQELIVRLRALGISPEAFKYQQVADADCVESLVTLAFLWKKQGRADEAKALTGRLMRSFGLSDLAEQSSLKCLLTLFADHPRRAQRVADFALRNLYFNKNDDWDLVAAVARSRILDDPQGEEGRLLAAHAQEITAALDERGNTDFFTSQLRDFWLADLPSGPRPALLDDPERWNDQHERAATTLAAGWMDRTEQLSAQHYPISLQDRYRQILVQASEITDMPTAEEADALAAELVGWANRLRDFSTLYMIHLMHGIHALDHPGGTVKYVQRYELALRALSARGAQDGMPDFVRSTADSASLSIPWLLVASPEVSWRQINEILTTERALLRHRSRSRVPLELAEAELAAHRGQRGKLKRAVKSVLAKVSDEEATIDRYRVLLDLIRITSTMLPDTSASLAAEVAGDAPDEQAVLGAAWEAWLRYRNGDDQAGAIARELMSELGGDFAKLRQIPRWVVMDPLATTDVDILPFVDAVMKDAEPITTSDFELFASVAGILLSRDPSDARGLKLRESALATAAALDTRDGTTLMTERVRSLWLKGLV